MISWTSVITFIGLLFFKWSVPAFKCLCTRQLLHHLENFACFSPYFFGFRYTLLHMWRQNCTRYSGYGHNIFQSDAPLSSYFRQSLFPRIISLTFLHLPNTFFVWHWDFREMSEMPFWVLSVSSEFSIISAWFVLFFSRCTSTDWTWPADFWSAQFYFGDSRHWSHWYRRQMTLIVNREFIHRLADFTAHCPLQSRDAD